MDEETSEWIEFSLALVVMMVALAIIKFSHASTFTLHDDGSMGSFYQEQQQRQREQERRKAPKVCLPAISGICVFYPANTRAFASTYVHLLCADRMCGHEL